MSTETETTTMDHGPKLEVGARVRGRVAHWKSDGWGFIELSPGLDLFVHRANLRDALELRVGDIVEARVARDSQQRYHGTDVAVFAREGRRTA